jgi:2-phospho-L-lactate/phosphoenolpyruvate guanylyltransferase
VIEQAGFCIALVPAKPLDDAKSRLAGVLNQRSRERLVEAMLEHVIATALSCKAINAVLMLGRRSPAYPKLDLLADPGGGLNAALGAALASVADNGVGRLLVIAGDLPLLRVEELDQLADLPPDTIGIAPDRHGIGTNALSLPLPGGTDFHFAYGSKSLALHRAEASRIGHDSHVVLGNGLAKDIDDPADLDDLAI